MKRSAWLRIIAVILIISMVAAPVSAAGAKGSTGTRNHLIGNIADMIRDLFRDRFGGSFGQPGEEPTTPSNPVDPTTPTEPGETEPEESEPEISLELIEGHANTLNGHLLRGVTYSLTEVLAAQSNPPFSLRNNGFGATSLGGNTAGSLSLGRTPLNAMAESDTTAVSAKIEGITGTGSSVDTTEPAHNKAVANAFDGNANTFWATVPGATLADCYLIADLGGTYTIDKVEYTKRYDSGAGYNCTGNLLNYIIEVRVGEDGEWTQVAAGDTVNGTTEITFTAVEATHVRLTSTSSYHWQAANANTVMTCAEFEVYGYTESTEEPESETKLVYFPVTMFNYEMDTMNTKTISMYEEGFTVYSGIHFSNGTPAAKDSVTFETTAHTGEYTNGQYVIQNYLMKDQTQPSWLSCSLEGEKGIIAVADKADAAIWTLTRRPGANVFTLTTEIDGTTYYMTLGNETSGVTTEYSEVTLVYYTHTTAGIQITKDGYYLGHSEDNLFCGNDNSTSTSNGMGFFPVAEDGTIGDTARNVTTINGPVTSGFARWNWWSYLEDGNAAQNKFFAELVQHELDSNGDIVFNVPEPGIFKTGTGDNIAEKDVYTNVGLPFVLDETTGIYSFDSDRNGVYFPDKDGDGDSDPASGTETNLELLKFDLGAPQGWSGMYYGDGSSKLWAPFNTNVNDDAEGHIDYHFGMRADIPFSMTPNGRIKSTDDNSDPISFTFSGDDDVWVFIDGHLVIDLGGIHNRIGATIDFANNTITYFLPESNTNTSELGCYNDRTRYPVTVDENGKQTITVKLYNDAEGEGSLGQTRNDFASEEAHTMSIFYMERGMGTSNCHISFNLPMRDTLLITKDASKSWSEEKDNEDGEDGDGTDYLTAKEQAAVDKLNFGFTLYKKTADETEFTAVTNTNFFVQDKTGKVIATSSTDGNGKFYLKNGQTAKFMTDIPKAGITYYVVEDAVPEGFLTPDYKYAGAATWGYDYIGEAILKDENGDYILDAEGNLTSGIVSGTATNAAEMGEHELPMDATENKSYEVTVKGSVESIDSIEFICTNYLDAELPNPSALANEDIIVIDYGLPVQIDPLDNDLFRGDNIEIVAWGDESLTLSHDTEGGTNWSGNKVLAAAKVAANNNSYNNALIDLADCLYTFKAVGDGCYEVSATTADGTKVYLNHYTSDTNEIPNDSIPSRIKIENGSIQNMFKLIAQVMDGGTGIARTLHFHTEQTVPYWNRCGNDNNHTCQEYLYRPAGKDDVSSTEIPGYVMVTSLDKIVDGGQYLIVHDKDANSTDDDLFVLHPSTSGDKYDHVAKLETTDVPAIGTSFSFDSGNVTFKDETYAEHAHEITNDDGTTTTTYTYTRDSFEYELTEQLTEVEEIRYIIKVTSSEVQDGTQITNTACRYALGKIYIVPATIMYYEENFSDMITFEGAGWDTSFTVSNQNNVSDFQEPGVVGTVGDSTYGSDVAYLSDNGDSNGTYRFGDTTNGAIRFTYTFTGTGTSIFARTSALTGYMQVKVYDADGKCLDIYYRDTYWKDTNNTNLDQSGTLYNIPVYTNEGLDYGTYTVVCTVAKKGTPTDGNMDGAGNEFYLDGIRVMQPLNEDADMELVDKALDAYTTDGEANLDVVTLRQKLITEAEDGVAKWDGENFVVLTDIDGAIMEAADYISIGPKEEVYLAPGQKVKFSLKYWEPEGLKLYMGMKAPFGGARVNIGHNVYELKNAPDCYYDVTDNYASLVTDVEQATDAEGNLLFLDDNDNIIAQIVNADDSVTYYYEDYETEFDNANVDQLRPLKIEYYIVTYTFEAAESIVSLTNIKVVGQFEFTIVENTDEEIDGDFGEGEDNQYPEGEEE